MNKLKNIRLLFITIIVLQFILAIRYGLKVPWGGDEWFSYKNFTLMGLPFSIITSLLKKFLGQVNTENYILYRAQGLLWSSIAYCFLYRISTKSDYDELSKFGIFIAVFLGLNPFFLETSQFFRYYQLYITSSIIITFGILKYDSVFRQRRKWFYIALFSSFLIHLFLFIQLIVYIIFKELFQLNRKNIILILTTFGFVALLIIPNLPSILVWSWHNLFPAYAFDFSLVHRGFRLVHF